MEKSTGLTSNENEMMMIHHRTGATTHDKTIHLRVYLHKYCIFFHNNSRNLIGKSIEFLNNVFIY